MNKNNWLHLLELIDKNISEKTRYSYELKELINEKIKECDYSMHYFEQEFEKLGYNLEKNTNNNFVLNNNFSVNKHFEFIIIYQERIEINVLSSEKDFYTTIVVDNELNNLITKFQNWYWRDK